MSRLFITPRELNFISDISKEVIKDVIGQKIYYFPISEIKTQTHLVYNEAMQKIFDNPIEIEGLIANPTAEVKVNSFGIDKTFTVEVYLQWRDLVDKGINVSIGDYFSFGDVFYEISEFFYSRLIYGMPEHVDGMKITGVKVRESQFKAKYFGPTDISYTEDDAVQKTFVQQRGAEENRLGKTNDVRDLQKNGVLESPLTGPKEVSEKVADPAGPGFYGED
jgi:hypothetical protein